MDVPGIGTIPQIGSVFVFAQGSPTSPPRQGEHTREVLGTLGMDESEIEELEKAGVIKISDA
jgi:crotonobetainyl-CoA:carnitine CoA-transferase CaiB-like acyl-CoA transferase